MNIECSGSGALVFIGNALNYVKGQICIGGCAVCYIDEKNYFGEVFMRIFEGRNIIIGRECLFSNDIWLWNSDSYLIYNIANRNRIAKAKSCYIGDHVWFGWSAGWLKKFFVVSGSIVGTRSVITGEKIFFSNTINGGYPCKEIKEGIFWIKDTSFDWNPIKEQAYESLQGVAAVEDFIYIFEKDKFLNPTLIEERLSAMDNPLDKLRFLYDYLYCNANKNRFALFSDSNFQESKSYCDNEGSFDRLNFLPAQRMPYS